MPAIPLYISNCLKVESNISNFLKDPPPSLEFSVLQEIESARVVNLTFPSDEFKSDKCLTGLDGILR